MSEMVREQCDRLFMATAPFVRAEQETHDALIVARAAYNAARKAAAGSRRAWVDFMLAHDHPSLCLGRPAPGSSEEGDG